MLKLHSRMRLNEWINKTESVFELFWKKLTVVYSRFTQLIVYDYESTRPFKVFKNN